MSNLSMAENYDRWESSLPKCGCCGKPIKDPKYHRIEFLGLGFNVCRKCLKVWKVENTALDIELVEV